MSKANEDILKELKIPKGALNGGLAITLYALASRSYLDNLWTF